jgi:hypothetical protein
MFFVQLAGPAWCVLIYFKNETGVSRETFRVLEGEGCLFVFNVKKSKNDTG